MSQPTNTAAPPPETPMTIAEASEHYGVNRRSLQRAVERGKVPARKIGHMYVVDNEAVRLFAVYVAARDALAAYTGTKADDE